ncbi:ParA family protein [Sphingoaurantiacus capsulatus]|uniref:ParA family protein n=1 Tax=Sphingoaurantiacus capsulatus TaxID=1771310 RepID=A0ABV7XBP5_9SPHN
MKAIAIYSGKGGVGKSTLAVHLAHMAATRSARRTLLWDLDAQGASTFALRLTPKPGLSARGLFAREKEIAGQALGTDIDNLDVIPADASLRKLDTQLAEQDKKNRLKKLLKELEGSYDRVVLDCPPSQADLSDQIFRAVDLLVVPLLPSPLSLRVYDMVVEQVAGKHGGKVPILPVFSMVDRRKSLHRDTVASRPDWPTIPYASEIERMAVHGQPVTARTPGSVAAAAFGKLWTRVERALND